MSRPAQPDDASPLERELVAERAHALRRSVDALEEALAALRDAEEAAASDPQSPVLAARRADAFAEAAERLWVVVVQREALGLRHHQDLLDALRVPRAVHVFMGPRRHGPG